MSLLRTFLACELPPLLQDAIQTATTGLRKTLGNDWIRWVPARNIHLTLKFLGDVSSTNLNMIEQMLTSEAAQHPVFDFEIKGFGSYPNQRHPRVLWVGLDAPAALVSLQRAVEAGTARLGYQPENRGFSPHLTVGRVRQNVTGTDLQTIRNALEETDIGSLGMVCVDAVHLFKSDLQRSGAVYTKLFSAPLLN